MKTYLGDSVYVDFRYGALVLTTENGGPASNTIVLEEEVYRMLVHYVETLEARIQASAKEQDIDH